VSEWAWVVLGFGITYGAMGGYLLILRRRTAAVRRSLGQLR
jgi:hypothetical protein